MTDGKLKPCPFCDSVAQVDVDHTTEGNDRYGCRNCNMWFDTFNSNDAIAAWNTRAAPKVKPLVWDYDKDPVVLERSDTVCGSYFIVDDNDDFTGFYLTFVSHDDAKWWQHVRSTSEVLEEHFRDDDIAPLKKLAQADCERRILAALEDT